MAIPAIQLAVFMEYQQKYPYMYPFVKTYNGVSFITLKIDTHVDAIPLPISGLTRGAGFRTIVTPMHWKMSEDSEGISLRVLNLQLIKTPPVVCEFINTSI